MANDKGIAPSASESPRYTTPECCSEGPTCPHYGKYAHGHVNMKDGMSYKAVEKVYESLVKIPKDNNL